MSYQNALIQPFTIGQQTDVEPHLIADSAFETLRNIYLYRGRLRRKFGYSHLGRLQIVLTAQALGNTGVSPFTVNILTTLGLTGVIIPGSVTVTIAAPIGPLVYTEPATPDGTLNEPTVPTTGTINYATGALTLNHPAGAASAVTIDFTYAKGLPVMGLANRELITLGFEELLAFDTEDAYLYNTATNRFNNITPVGTPWTGTNADFFWTWNYWTVGGANLLWVTNNVAADRIRYYAGGGAGGWTVFTPQLNAGNTRQLWTSLLIVSYRNRLVCLNTQERDTGLGTTTNYQNRARWSANGNPTTANLWQDDVIGRGGYIDAPTTERIITADFVKDTLVVGFERSTWILKYTGNEILPFIWERVNEELGCESTHSSVVFDNFMFQIGGRGINAANPSGSERIDMSNPYLVQQIHNDQSGQQRVHGIRDFTLQMVYWTYPTASFDQSAYRKVFPDSIIAYNYLEQAFATFDASFTCFGNYQPANDMTWDDFATKTWEEANFAWNSGQTQAGYPSIVAGNQVGFVHQLRQTIGNAVSVYISGITLANPCVITSPNHNFQDGQCIYIEDVIGTTELNDNYYFANNCTTNTFEIQELNTDTTSPLYGTRQNVDSTGFTAYSGHGLIIPVDNFHILTKQYNPYEGESMKARIGQVGVFMDRTTSGAFNLNVYIDQNQSTAINVFTVPSTKTTNPPLDAGKYWEYAFVNTVANYLQLELDFSDFQLIDDAKNVANMEISAFAYKFAPSGRTGSFS